MMTADVLGDGGAAGAVEYLANVRSRLRQAILTVTSALSLFQAFSQRPQGTGPGNYWSHLCPFSRL